MRRQIEDPAEEIKRLRRCINDLVSVLALPAIWTGGGPSHVVGNLLDALMSMLNLEFIYARLGNSGGSGYTEMMRIAPTLEPKPQPQEISERLQPWLTDDPQKISPVVSNFFDGRDIALVSLQLGLHGEMGVLVAGSGRLDFPQQTERLILNVAANQAAIGLQEANILRELDQRVAQRTAELTAANEQLHEARAALEKAFDELKKSETKLRQVIDAIPTLAWCSLPDGSNEFLSKSWHEYTGLGEEAHGWGWQVAFHADDLPPLIEKWRKMLVSEEPGEIEARIRRHDGVYRWFFIRAEPFRDEEGKLVRWYGISTDIDDRKRAEEALKVSESRFRAIIDTIPTMAWSANPDGYCDFVNRRWLEVTGLSSEQVQGWNWKSAIHPDDLNGLVEIWQSSLASGAPAETEARMRRFDGTYRWFLFRASPLHDESGKIVKWYGTNIDVDERKQAEDQLRRNEDVLAKGQRLSLTGSFSWCVDTNEIVFSDEAYRIFEFDRDSAVTMEKIADRVQPEDRWLLAAKNEEARGPGGAHDYEIRLRMPNGSVKFLRTMSSDTKDINGRREYVGVVQDVTQWRLTEDALNKARSELYHVARVTALSALTASIAHEVNQPLSGIVTNAGTCLRMLDANPPNLEGARETVRRTLRDGNRASEVITRLRALFSRKEATFEIFDLNGAAEEVIALLMSDLQRNRVILKTDLAADLPGVLGDRIQIQQVILNLVRNASDAMRRVYDRPRELLIRTERDESGGVHLSVKDSGVGIDPEIESKLFEPFHTTKSDGMGIGLSISRSIMESHRGRLLAIRNDGAGATFTFSIPCSANT